MRRFQKRSGRKPREPLFWVRNCFANSIERTGTGAELGGCNNAKLQAADVLADPTTIRLAPIDSKWTVRRIRREISLTMETDGGSSKRWMDAYFVTVMTSNAELQNRVGTGGTSIEDVLTGGALGEGPWDVLAIKHFSVFLDPNFGIGTFQGAGAVQPVATFVDPWDINVQRKLDSDQVIADVVSLNVRAGSSLPSGFGVLLRWSEVTSVLWQRTMRK